MSRVSTRDVIGVLPVTGGVPKYLEDIRPSLPSDENIRRLCFRSNGMLVKEFEEIFAFGRRNGEGTQWTSVVRP